MNKLKWESISKYSDAPGTCGVYQYWREDELLYIGKAINLKARLSSHAQNARLDAKEAAIVSGNIIKYTLCDSEFKALMLEAELIRTLKPPHNRAWKDDKSYLYIVINTNDVFPRPYFARAHDLTFHLSLARLAARQVTSHLHIFGPFPNAFIAEEVLRAIRRLIPFCMAKKIGKHACFYSRIGLCSPCPSNILKLPADHCKLQTRQYRRQIRQVIKILDGDIDIVLKSLNKEMRLASKEQDYEGALGLRKKIERFTRFISDHRFKDIDFSYNNSAEKLSVLHSFLTCHFSLVPSLHRIECYDASNSAIYDSVVSMTVMTDGLLDNGAYRRFKIKNPRAHSDFDRLDEALSRRLKNKSWPRPDLIVIDGGIPQLRRLQKVFDKQADPPLYIGLAKHPDRIVTLRDDPLKSHTTNSESSSLAIELLEQLRDEAHRFANNYRKILEKKRTRL